MTFAIATKKKGNAVAMAPDVLKTPAVPSPVPMPYPNTGMLSTATAVEANVLVENIESVVDGSKIPSSVGGEAGTAGGVISGVNCKEVLFKEGSSAVYFGGKKVMVHTSSTAHNGSNANVPLGCHAVPSQEKVFAKR
jgi:hypothetical protein